MLDAIIVGGGPAGLSAALVLGRCLRRVLVCDAGHPRNEPARIFNGYPLARWLVASGVLANLPRSTSALRHG